MADGYAKLCEQIAKMSEEEATASFDFSADPKKCGVRWQYDRCLRDLLIHLHEWQVLMRVFVQNIRDGRPKDYLPDEYRRNYHEMDKMLVEKHQDTPLEEAKRLLALTQEEMLRLTESFTEEELFTQLKPDIEWLAQAISEYKPMSYDETVAELAEKGIECEPVRCDTFTGEKMTFFHDPDGLPIEIHE